MKCPKCNDPLNRSQYAGTNVQACSTCHGYLIEQHRATKVERRINKDINQLKEEVANSDGTDLSESIRCPRCRDRMQKKAVGELEFHVDECGNCDFAWFDGGELAKLQLIFESNSQTQEVNQMRQRLNSMTPTERQAYEDRIANLVDLGSPMEQAAREATFDLAHDFVVRKFLS